MFLSEKVEAFWRLAISSNCGCRHVPVTGVAGFSGVCGFVVGVAGVGGRVALDMMMCLELVLSLVLKRTTSHCTVSL